MSISQSALNMLCDYDWPGNVRELRNCLERAVIMTESEIINEDVIILHSTKGIKKNSENLINFTLDFASPDFSLQSIENEVLSLVLKKCNGNKTMASKILKIDRKAFYRNDK